MEQGTEKAALVDELLCDLEDSQPSVGAGGHMIGSLKVKHDMFFQIAPLFLLSRCGWPPKRIR